MTVQTVPYALQNASHSAAVFRQATSAPFQSAGILGAGELAVTQQGTPNMSVILGAGRAMVAGSQVTPPAGLSFTTQAMYNVLNDGSITLTVTTSNPTNPRIDAVYVGVQDAFYSGSNNQAVAGIVVGVPAPSPVAPSVPVNSQLVAYIAVGAGVTSIVNANITAKAPLAALMGGVPTVTRFKGSILTPTAITHDANINYSTIVEDTAGGWNAAGAYYSIPAVGTYLFASQIKSDTSGTGQASILLRKNGANVAASPNSPSGSFVGINLVHYETCAVADQISVWAHGGANWTTINDSPAQNNYLEIVKIA